jgi:hypothetical protein
MLRTGGWAELPDELLAKVLELLQAAGQQRGLGFSQASATVRLVCAGWKAVHDALVTRLVLRRETTDEAVGMLVLRFPAVASVEMKSVPGETLALTDQGVRALSSSPPALTSLDLSRCKRMTDQGQRAVSSVSTLRSLNLTACWSVKDQGVRAPVKVQRSVWPCSVSMRVRRSEIYTALPIETERLPAFTLCWRRHG